MNGFHKPEGGFPLEPEPLFGDLKSHIQYIKWWHKLLLPFCKSYKNVDGNYWIEIKMLFGKMFVINSGYLLPNMNIGDQDHERA